MITLPINSKKQYWTSTATWHPNLTLESKLSYRTTPWYPSCSTNLRTRSPKESTKDKTKSMHGSCPTSWLALFSRSTTFSTTTPPFLMKCMRSWKPVTAIPLSKSSSGLSVICFSRAPSRLSNLSTILTF